MATSTRTSRVNTSDLVPSGDPGLLLMEGLRVGVGALEECDDSGDLIAQPDVIRIESCEHVPMRRRDRRSWRPRCHA